MKTKAILNTENIMSEMENKSIDYEYKDFVFTIAGSENFHKKLMNDDNYASKYFEDIIFDRQRTVDENSGVEAKTVNSSDNSPPVKRQRLEQQSLDEDTLTEGIWDIAGTKFLLHEYFLRRDRFRNPKIKKVELWREISEEFKKINMHFASQEINKKFANMKMTYSKIKKNNSKSTTGTGRKPWLWLSDMDEIFHKDLSINFPSDTVASMQNIENIEPINLSSPSTSKENSFNSSTSSISLTPKACSSEVRDDEDCMEVSPKFYKSARAKGMYYHRQKQLVIDTTKLETMKEFNKKFDEQKILQRESLSIWNDRMVDLTKVLKERNDILKKVVQVLGDNNNNTK